MSVYAGSSISAHTPIHVILVRCICVSVSVSVSVCLYIKPVDVDT